MLFQAAHHFHLITRSLIWTAQYHSLGFCAIGQFLVMFLHVFLAFGVSCHRGHLRLMCPLLFGAHQVPAGRIVRSLHHWAARPSRARLAARPLLGVRGARRKHEGQDGCNNRGRFQKKNFPEGEAGNGTQQRGKHRPPSTSPPPLRNETNAVTCTYECTFCSDCVEQFSEESSACVYAASRSMSSGGTLYVK